MTYKREFLEAIEVSKRLGAKEPVKTCLDSSTPILTEDLKKRIYSFFQSNFVDHPEYKKILSGGCVAVSSMLKPLIESMINDEVIITLGYIKCLGDRQFNASVAEFENARLKGIKKLKWETHVWLTLPSYEVIDFTLYYTLTSINPAFKSVLPIVRMNTVEFNGSDKVELHPLIVGEEIMHNLFETVTLEGDDLSDLIAKQIVEYKKYHAQQ